VSGSFTFDSHIAHVEKNLKIYSHNHDTYNHKMHSDTQISKAT